MRYAVTDRCVCTFAGAHITCITRLRSPSVSSKNVIVKPENELRRRSRSREKVSRAKHTARYGFTAIYVCFSILRTCRSIPARHPQHIRPRMHPAPLCRQLSTPHWRSAVVIIAVAATSTARVSASLTSLSFFAAALLVAPFSMAAVKWAMQSS